MKKLFLVSSFNDVADKLLEVEKNLSGKRVTFIPTASNVEKVNFFVKSGRKALEKLGLIVDEVDVATAEINDMANKLRQNDYIYLTGGNTFYLMQELKRTGVDEIIAEQVNLGKLYIGESAGAMIAANDIEYAKAMDSVKKAPDLKDFSALGLVEFFPVPHYTNFPFAKAVEKIIETYGQTLKLMPITNKQAIAVMGEVKVL